MIPITFAYMLVIVDLKWICIWNSGSKQYDYIMTTETNFFYCWLSPLHKENNPWTFEVQKSKFSKKLPNV